MPILWKCSTCGNLNNRVATCIQCNQAQPTVADATAYKVVARYREMSAQSSWEHGKPGTQYKKKVYINKADFDRYSPAIIKRWGRYHDITIFAMVNGLWVSLKAI